jgi:rare lipoprotein A (peptidoglycan hydrolase)
MRKIFKIALPILLVVGFFIGSSTYVQANNWSEEYTKLSNIKKRVDTARKGLKNKKQERKTLESQISSIDKTLQKIQLEITEIQTKSDKIQLEIDEIQEQVDERQEEMNEKKETLKECIKAMYEQEKISTLEILIASQSLSEFIDQKEYVSVVEDKTKKNYDEIKQIKEELKRQKKAMDGKKLKLIRLQEEKEMQQKTIEAELTTKQTFLTRVNGEEKSFQQQISTPQYFVENESGKQIIYGIATWYGPGFENRNTASGITFDPKKIAAAHQNLPLGTLVRVTNLLNNLSCVVVINDRGPYSYHTLDLTRAAADAIDMESIAFVMIEVL